MKSELLVLLRENRKIEAIKLYRSRTGAGLKEAKTAVETIGSEEPMGTAAPNTSSSAAGFQIDVLQFPDPPPGSSLCVERIKDEVILSPAKAIPGGSGRAPSPEGFGRGVTGVGVVVAKGFYYFGIAFIILMFVLLVSGALTPEGQEGKEANADLWWFVPGLLGFLVLWILVGRFQIRAFGRMNALLGGKAAGIEQGNWKLMLSTDLWLVERPDPETNLTLEIDPKTVKAIDTRLLHGTLVAKVDRGDGNPVEKVTLAGPMTARDMMWLMSLFRR